MHIEIIGSAASMRIISVNYVTRVCSLSIVLLFKSVRLHPVNIVNSVRSTTVRCWLCTSRTMKWQIYLIKLYFWIFCHHFHTFLNMLRRLLLKVFLLPSKVFLEYRLLSNILRRIHWIWTVGLIANFAFSVQKLWTTFESKLAGVRWGTTVAVCSETTLE